MNFADWKNDLPAGWGVVPLRAVADYEVSNVDKLTDEQEVPVRLCNYVDVYHNEFITSELPFMETTATEAEIEKFGVKVDDVIITKDSESWDDIGIPALIRETAPDLVCGYHLAQIRPRAGKLFGAFLLRALQAKPIRLHLELAANGVTRFGIPKSDIGSMALPLPPVEQQRTIADFLDAETARIDELIASKENLLAILTEKRRALVAQAVTRGLDPDVKMRDSGVPWLGEIPAHWEVVPFRFLADMASGATLSTGEPLFWDGDIPWVSPKDMKRIEIADAQDHVTPLALSSTTLHLIRPPVVLIVVRGMILAHTFPVAITTAPITINQDMKALRPRGGLSALFLRDFLRGIDTHILSIVGESAHGTRKLETELLGRVEMCVPPVEEQEAIVDYINREHRQIDGMSSAVERSLVLFRERREAVIAAAVTGQLDVGEFYKDKGGAYAH